MKSLSEQFQYATRSVKLSHKERDLMREHLVSYMGYKPIRPFHAHEVAKRTLGTRQNNPLFSSIGGFFQARHLAGALVIVLCTSGFGVTFAAADALPGDFLYPVKVDVSEEVKAVFMPSDEARIAWERERAVRRLEEASMLAAEGRLSQGLQEEVTKRFIAHTEEVVRHVADVEHQDPILAAEVSSDFEETLTTHESVLARLMVEHGPEHAAAGKGLVEEVRSAALKAGDLADEAEQKLAVADDSNVSAVMAATDDGTTAADAVSTQPLSQGQDVVGIDSPNLREQAVARAEVHARTSRESALLGISKLDTREDALLLAQSARKEIERADIILSNAALAREQNELGEAYRAYKAAGAIFRKVDELVEVAGIFDIEIVTGVVDGVDATAVTAPSTDATVVEPVPASDTVDTSPVAQRSTGDEYAQAKKEIAEAQAQLLRISGIDEEALLNINGVVKDALAHLMRGEIASVLGDDDGAWNLYHAARGDAKRALELMDQYTDASAASTDTSQGEVPQAALQPPVGLMELDVVQLTHVYSDGLHTYQGTYYTPTACFGVDAAATVAESYPEQITIDLTVVEREAGCPTLLTPNTFTVQAQASGDAQLTQVRIQGAEVKWNLTAAQN